MYLENFLSALDIWISNHNLSVETSGTEKCGVEDITSVGGCDNDNALVALKAVHFNKELVKGLLTLIVTAAKTCASLTAHSVDLIDEYDSGGIFLCCFKKVSYTACTHAHEHLNEVRA